MVKKIPKPPTWQEALGKEEMRQALFSDTLDPLIRKAQKEYLYWDTFRYQPMPEGIMPEDAWAILKLRRMGSYQKTPIRATDNNYFNFTLTNYLQQRLNYIDTNAAGFVNDTKLTDAQKNKFIIAGLTEEAIATSQIEGANTTRKVAKEMLASQRPPRTRGEQMIVNSYHVMQKLDTWKHLDLNPDMLLEMQSIVTEKAVDEIGYQGRYRTDEDDIVVKDPISGEIAHVPPRTEIMRNELSKLLTFANKENGEEEDFLHPVIKASLLHFWVAYLHPFPDGNGRTARAVFYWYLLKHKYRLISYLSVSRAIVNSRKRYDDAFLYSEYEHDVTYFLHYITDAFKEAIEKFMEYVKEKQEETEDLKKIADALKEYNERQVAVMRYFLRHEKETVDIYTHQAKHGVSRATAYNDLVFLVAKGLLVQTRHGKRFVFMPHIPAIKKLLQ